MSSTSSAMYSSALACLAISICVGCAPEGTEPAPHALERQSIVLPDDDGAPAFRVEATFVGDERVDEIRALLDGIEVVPVEDGPSDGPSAAERAAYAIDALSADGGDGIVVQVHPLREDDRGQRFGYTVHLVEQTLAADPMPVDMTSADGIGSSRHAITLSPHTTRFHDLWCWGLRARYRIRSGSGLFTVVSPMFAPLPARSAWRTTNLWAPAPWPSPWLVFIQNSRGTNLVYDMSLTCNL